MQQFFFGLGHFMEWTFGILTALGWLPVVATTAILSFGFLYWMMLQARYNRKAKANNTIA